jgi:hypothetical protein
MVSLSAPFFTHVFNDNAAPLSLPAQAALGNILKVTGRHAFNPKALKA